MGLFTQLLNTFFIENVIINNHNALIVMKIIMFFVFVWIRQAHHERD